MELHLEPLSLGAPFLIPRIEIVQNAYLVQMLYFFIMLSKLIKILLEIQASGGELLELLLLDTRLLDTFGRKSIARHKF